MAKKDVRINYFFPIRKQNDGKEKVVDLKKIFNELSRMEPKDRIMPDGEGNIQLKRIEYNSDEKKWMLCFLRNGTDSPFKSKLDDNTYTAEQLEEDEFVGHECCAIYDEVTRIIALQNNRNSISFSGVSQFLIKYSKNPLSLSAITYNEKYCEISDDALIEYKSVIIGFTDAGKLKEIANSDESKDIEVIAKLANDMSAINGKIELGVGRTKNFLGKYQLKCMVDFFRKNKEITSSLKVKMIDNDTIRLIDLLNYKVSDKFEIAITKDDPKTFDKILFSMNSIFNDALEQTFDKCNLLVNS